MIIQDNGNPGWGLRSKWNDDAEGTKSISRALVGFFVLLLYFHNIYIKKTDFEITTTVICRDTADKGNNTHHHHNKSPISGLLPILSHPDRLAPTCAKLFFSILPEYMTCFQKSKSPI